MRIAQLIDSLEAGGAEKMAVNYANSLSNEIDCSFLIATRKEGILKSQIDEKVNYLFLERKLSLDFSAVFRLKSFLKNNKVDILHAHGTSFFIGMLLKLIYPKVKLIWHEHYGARVNQSIKSNLVLYISSFTFSMIFVVNQELVIWMKDKLSFKRVFYIPNFAILALKALPVTFLKGHAGKRIVFLANLKNPKNHIMVLRIFNKMNLASLGWSLHLIGKDYYDDYSENLKQFISYNNMEESIYIYNLRNDIEHILSQADIGILSSTAEGFPVALLEYGLAGLCVISTNTGFCSQVVKDNIGGSLFDPSNDDELERKLNDLIKNESLRNTFAINLQEFIQNNFSENSVIQALLSKYNTL